MGVAMPAVGLKVGAAKAAGGRKAAGAVMAAAANPGVAMGAVADPGVANAGRMAAVTTGAAGMAEEVHRHRLTGTKDLKFYWVC